MAEKINVPKKWAKGTTIMKRKAKCWEDEWIITGKAERIKFLQVTLKYLRVILAQNRQL